MLYKSDLGQMLCHYCGRSQQLTRLEAYEDSSQGISLETYIQNPLAQLRVLSNKAFVVDCEGCGANLIFEPPDEIRHCPFCNRQTLTLPRPADPALPPVALLPFKLDLTQAQQIKQQALSPNRFLLSQLEFFLLSQRTCKALQRADVTGIYIPFWVYDCNVTINYTASAWCKPLKQIKKNIVLGLDIPWPGVGETSWAIDTSAESFRKTLSGSYEDTISDQLVCAIQSADVQALGQWLMDIDIGELQPFQQKYLQGFKVYRYQTNAQQGFAAYQQAFTGEPFIPKANEQLEPYQNKLHDDAFYISASVDAVTPEFSNVCFRQILLPLWIAPPVEGQEQSLLIHGSTGSLCYMPTLLRLYSARKLLLALIITVAYIATFSRSVVLGVLLAPLAGPVVITFFVALGNCFANGMFQTIDPDFKARFPN